MRKKIRESRQFMGVTITPVAGGRHVKWCAHTGRNSPICSETLEGIKQQIRKERNEH